MSNIQIYLELQRFRIMRRITKKKSKFSFSFLNRITQKSNKKSRKEIKPQRNWFLYIIYLQRESREEIIKNKKTKEKTANRANNKRHKKNRDQISKGEDGFRTKNPLRMVKKPKKRSLGLKIRMEEIL